jgi:flagellar biogenesis protein FliO
LENFVMTLVWLQTAPAPADPLAGINTPLIEYVQVMLVLAGVLAIAYVTLRFGLPRFFGLRGSARGPIETVARYRLEPKKTLYLVKVGSQMFLIGTSEGQVEYLTGVAAENAAEILESSRLEQSRRKDFRQVLNWVHKAGKAAG